MKLKIILFILSSISLITANDKFTYIQPVSVEKASKKIILPQTKVIKEEIEEVIKEEKENTQSKKDEDSDKDGILDSKDECQDTKENYIVDEYGCAQIKTPIIIFEPYSMSISQKSKDSLNELAEFLNKNEDYHVVIYGHTDTSGDEDKNKTLSTKRAKAVKKALETLGVNRIRLTALGKGSTEPIADNETFEGRVENRRIEIEILH